jgi:hypothetical protein
MKFPSERAALLLLCTGLSGASGCVITQDPMLDPPDAGGDVLLDSPRPDTGFRCTPDALGCFGDTRYRCGEDGISRLEEHACDDACDVTLGCVACVPGARRCDGTVSEVCLDDGSGWTHGRDCGDWDVACGDDGYCEDACALAESERSYIGCDYWASPLANYDGLRSSAYDFRVVVANTGAQTAEITVTRGSRLIERENVPPGAVVDLALPWIDEVSFPFASDPAHGTVVPDGAYRVRSSRPVVVAQFNPFQYAAPGSDFSYTNDASLLLPAHVLGTDYVGISYLPLSAEGSSEFIPGYLALVGHDPAGTEVEIISPVDVAADRSGRWSATAAGERLSFTLARGEVAELVASPPPPCDETRPGYIAPSEGVGYCEEPEHDLTGALIHTSAPVAAFGGHTCANAPVSVGACDHLETTLAPTSTWGTRFVTAPLTDPASPMPNLLRIVAAHDDTEVTLDPPPSGLAATHVLARGEVLDALLTRPITIVASQPIEVAQILVGQNYTDPPQTRGDPALTIVVPEEQFRSSYVFITPTSYTAVTRGQSWLLISRDPGSSITLDGVEVVAGWARIGDRELATVPVSGGAHRATGTARFGVVAFGLGQYTSYAYPAGLDFVRVPF